MEEKPRSDYVDIQEAGEILAAIDGNSFRFVKLGQKIIEDQNHPMRSMAAKWAESTLAIIKHMSNIHAYYQTAKEIPDDLFKNWCDLSDDQRENDYVDIQEAGEILAAINGNLARLVSLSQRIIMDQNHSMRSMAAKWIESALAIIEHMSNIYAYYQTAKEIPDDLFKNWRNLSDDQRENYFYSMSAIKRFSKRI